MKVYAMKINFTQLTSIMHFMLVLSNEDEITDSEIPLFRKFLAPFRLTKEQEQNILENHGLSTPKSQQSISATWTKIQSRRL